MTLAASSQLMQEGQSQIPGPEAGSVRRPSSEQVASMDRVLQPHVVACDIIIILRGAQMSEIIGRQWWGGVFIE